MKIKLDSNSFQHFECCSVRAGTEAREDKRDISAMNNRQFAAGTTWIFEDVPGATKGSELKASILGTDSGIDSFLEDFSSEVEVIKEVKYIYFVLITFIHLVNFFRSQKQAQMKHFEILKGL